ncbi:MAG: outer membrane protein assembly factor BamA [Candidatus Kapaibacterium sp.]
MHLKSLKPVLIYLFVILSAASLTLEQAAAQLPTGSPGGREETYTIAGISVEGNDYSDSETIISLSGLRVGEQINAKGDTKLQEAVRNLWNRRQFSDVEIIVDRVTQVGLFLIIRVEEFPRLSNIEIENNEELNSDEIREATGKTRGDIISNYDVYTAKKSIQKLYSEEGLAFAKVEIDLDDTDTSAYRTMNIYVEEGVEFHVERIEFEGNENFSDDDLAGSFEETSTKSWWQFWKSSKFNREDYQADKKHLITFYKSNGFIDARVVKDSIIYDEDEEAVYLNITVEEGQRIYIRNIDFDGNTVYTNNSLINRLDFKPGDPYDVQRFQQNLLGNEEQTDVSSLYLDNGYLMANFIPEESRVADDSVDILINIYEKDRFKMRKIIIKGNTKTKDKVIRRELYTRPGEFFDRSAIIRSIRALGVLNYFNPEGLKPEVQPVDDTSVDIVYNVEERSTDTFNASIGFAGSFGLTGAIGFTFNNFSISEPLKGGAGQVFNFNWEFGQASRYRTFSLGFSEPWLFDEPTSAGFNLYDTKIDYIGINQRRTGFQLNLGRRFSWPDDYWRGDWSTRFQINDIGEDTRSSWYRPGRQTEIAIVQKFSRISLNNMFFPSTGSRFSISTDFAMGALGMGSTDFLKNEINFEIYNPIMQIDGMDRLVLMLNSRMGYIAGIETDTTIAPIELYRMGGNGLSGFGVTPLRGYPDQSIGNESGNRVLAKYVAELRFALSLDPMPIYVYGFAEAGNVWENLESTDPFNLKRAAGLGIQLMVQPIGVIGFSYGYGFDPAVGTGENVSGWRFLFHLGQ